MQRPEQDSLCLAVSKREREREGSSPTNVHLFCRENTNLNPLAQPVAHITQHMGCLSLLPTSCGPTSTLSLQGGRVANYLLNSASCSNLLLKVKQVKTKTTYAYNRKDCFIMQRPEQDSLCLAVSKREREREGSSPTNVHLFCRENTNLNPLAQPVAHITNLSLPAK